MRYVEFFISGGLFINPKNVPIAAYPHAIFRNADIFFENLCHMVQRLIFLSSGLLVGMIYENNHILCTVL